MTPLPPRPQMPLAEALDLALTLYQEGKPADARVVCRAILRSLPEQAEAVCLLSMIELALGRDDDARRLFAAAIALKPDFPDAYRNFGTLERSRHRLEDARHLYCRVHALRPDDADILCELGLIHRALGEEDAAADWLRLGVERDPAHLPVREAYGTFCEGAARRALGCDDPAGAAVCCKQALAVLSDAPRFSLTLYALLERLVRIALIVKEPDTALALLAVRNRYDFHDVPASEIDSFPLTLLGFTDWCAASGIRCEAWTAPAQPLPAGLRRGYPDGLHPHIDALLHLGETPVGVALDADIEVVQGFYVKDNYESYVLADRRSMLCENTEVVVAGSRVPLVGVTPGATAGAFRIPRPLYTVVERELPCLFLPSTPNYWHFLVEVLPRLMVRERVPEVRPLPILLFDLRGYHYEMLELIGIPRAQVIDARGLVGPDVRQVLYRLRRAAVPSAVPYPVAYRWLRERLLPRRSHSVGPSRRVFLSRRGSAPKHRIANDAAVGAYLAGYGFETVQPETLGVLETIELIAEAEIVVAPVGAATGNQVFLPPGGNWIHLNNPDFFHADSRWNSQMGTQIPLMGAFRHLTGRFTGDPAGLPEDLLTRLDVPMDIDLDDLGRIVEEVIARRRAE